MRRDGGNTTELTLAGVPHDVQYSKKITKGIMGGFLKLKQFFNNLQLLDPTKKELMPIIKAGQ